MAVVIAGAGIGGLTAALSLHAAGFEDVRVLEATDDLRPLGVGLNLLPNAVRELTELGLLDELVGRAITTAELRLYHLGGGLVWHEPRGLDAGYRWPQLSIHRGELQQVLLAAVRERLGPEAVTTGSPVLRVDQERPDTVAVTVAGAGRPDTVTAHVLIGADGLHSTVRSQFHPDEGGPCTNGLVMWRGTTWAPPFLTGRSMVVIGDDRHRFVIYPIIPAGEPGGPVLVNWVTALPATSLEHLGAEPGEADRGEVLRRFGDWQFPGIDIPGLIDGADAILQYPMQDREPLDRWVFGRVALLGDAAHPMYPAGSNGATQAIVDARVLAHHLAGAGPDDIDGALAAYEAERRPAMTRLQRANRTMGPERVINLAHERAPDGFRDIREVISADELAAVATEYAELSGHTPETLNARPSYDAHRRFP